VFFVAIIFLNTLSTKNDAVLAVHAGASALGFVSAMPSGTGVISEKQITGISKTVPSGISRFLLSSRIDTPKIIKQAMNTGADVLQLVDSVSADTRRQLRKALPNVRLVQVIHVCNERAINEARQASETVDGILLDSGNPAAKIRTLGGTGQRHNWEISRKICECVGRPVFLAGGLTPENVADAINIVHPFGVDICLGVRSSGKLNAELLKRFITAVRSAEC